MEDANWARQESDGINLGDKRLDDRSLLVLDAIGNQPQSSIPMVTGGSAEMKAAYRFFDNPKVTLEKILDPHVHHSQQRIAQYPEILLVQDTTEIDLTKPELLVKGAGSLDGSRQGFLLHEMQAFPPDRIPLGTVHAQIINRIEGVSKATHEEKEQARKANTIQEKESHRWLEGLRCAGELAKKSRTSGWSAWLTAKQISMKCFWGRMNSRQSIG